MTKTLRALLLLTIVLVTAAVAGCGSATSGSGTDTASVAPSNSFFYAEATIDPAGGQQAAMRSILGDLPGSGPARERLNNLLEQASKSDKNSHHIDYRRDVQPWLGDKASAFAAGSKSGTGKPAWAAALATTDTGKAQDFIKKGRDPSDRDASYRGVKYLIAKDGTAVGTLDGFLVIGSRGGFQDAVDASKGQALSATDSYKQAVASAKSERVGLVYEDLGGLFQAVAGASGRSLGPAAPFLGRMLAGKPVVATISAENQALVVDGSLFPSSSALGLSGASTPLLGQVPSDSWLAFGVSDFGQSLKGLIGLVGGALGGQQMLEQQLRSATGLDLQQDVLSWIGDLAVFVNGDSKSTVGGGALIKSTNPDASRNALTKLAALAAKRSGGGKVSAAKLGGASGYRLEMGGAREPVYLLQSGDTVAIVRGERAARAAFGGGVLSDSPGFKNAAAKLGDGYTPDIYMSAGPILRLVQSFGAHERGYQKARPYLSVLDYIVAGSARSGSGVATRARIGFKPHE